MGNHPDSGGAKKNAGKMMNNGVRNEWRSITQRRRLLQVRNKEPYERRDTILCNV